MMRRFTVPRDIWYGRGSIAKLAEVPGKRAVIVTGGGSMKRTGVLDRVLDYLKQANMGTLVIADVEPDPSVETVMTGAEKMREFCPDLIVGVGGGSPIDAAKAMWVFYEHPDAKLDDIITPFSFPPLRSKARFVAIPSTSGTATEVTAFSVVTDYAKGIKYPLADFEITPDIAIVDPDLADTMPASLAADTGMDVLTHSIEAYVSTAASPFTDPLALSAIRTVFSKLPVSVSDSDKDAREAMHYASCLAGMAFSNALLGIVHSMAHKTGAAFSTGHIPHGRANAIYLPYVIEYNSRDERARKRYAVIARRCGLCRKEMQTDEVIGAAGNIKIVTEPENCSAAGASSCSDEDAAAALAGAVRDMNRRFGIPATLREFGVDEREFEEKVADIAKNAVGDACTGSNPRKITPPEMERLLRCCYNGTKVDF